MNYYIYILANISNSVLYTGVTNNLSRRIYEHKKHLDQGSFTTRYNVDKLVYFEVCSNAVSAIEREKQIKGWNRKRKNKLVESQNPNWIDLYGTIL